LLFIRESRAGVFFLFNLESAVVVSPDARSTFLLVGSLWTPEQASTKTSEDYRQVFRQFLPFYDELILAPGRYVFLDP
jgi:hypothetical protein